MLLPRPPGKENDPEEDPRQELVERLLEYRRLKEMAQSLAEVDRLRLGIWTRRPQPLPAAPEDEEQQVDLGEVSLFDLMGAFKTALQRYEKEHPPPLQLSLEEFSVRGQFDRLWAFWMPGDPSTWCPTSRTAPAAPRPSPCSWRCWSWRGSTWSAFIRRKPATSSSTARRGSSGTPIGRP